MTIITRFAPSPTGHLHVGNIRTALLNWLWARQAGGRFLLRMDDTDRQRSTQAFADAIDADLAWLGLAPDGKVRQSDRVALYQRRFDAMVAAGRIYPAYETADELELRRKVLAGRGLPPIYDRAALKLSDQDRAALEADGRRPHWRFRLDHGSPIRWNDMIRGDQAIDPAAQSDPVVRREDGSWLYMLPSAIDDMEMGITHVVRGEDHVTNTALQIQMFEAMGVEPPRFAHAALLVGSEGKLSKRLGSLGCDAFREAGIEPLAIAALLARIGTSDPVEAVADMAPLMKRIDFAHFGRAPARFDLEELVALNARTIHLLPFSAVVDRLPAGMGEGMWAAIAPNLQTVAEAADWMPVLTGEIAPPPLADGDRAFAGRAAELVPTLNWATDPWHSLTGALKAESGRKGRQLFLPLRLALTGRDHGPDMATLLPLIDPARAMARLEAAARG